MTRFRKDILAGVFALLTVGFGAESVSAQQTTVRYPDQDAAEFSAYGLLNPSIVSVDDGVGSYSKAVDNGHAPSRLGFWVRQPFYGAKLAFNFETAIGLRPSSGVNQVAQLSNFDWNRRKLRKIEFILDTENVGKFYLGQGSVSNDGVANSDLSGTGLVLGSSIGDAAGAYLFRDSTQALTTRAIGVAMPNFDGGRRARIRYDTPTFKGLTLSASYGKEVLVRAANFETQNVALRYVRDVGSVKMKGALGYARIDLASGAKRHDTVGSFSVLHTSGWNASISAGDRRESGHYGYGKIGYRGDWLSAGATAISVDYYAGSDMTVSGSQSDAIGLGVVQSLDKSNVKLYAAYRDYGLAEPTTSYLDASSFQFGAAWSF